MKQINFPGMVDLQINGFAGVDFNDPASTADQLHHAAAEIRATGVTLYLPTLITSSLKNFSDCARALLRLNESAMVGIHMEGPYISPDDGPRGAHAKEHVRTATLDDFKRRQEAAEGRIILVTLAPEVPGAIELIEYLVSTQIKVAIGHTAASPEQIRDAVAAGASLSTHLGNGCAQTLPRHPNFIWEQLAEDQLHASFICDGHHLPATTVKTMIRAKSPARSILVTDATAAAGCTPGSYMIGGLQVELSPDGRVASRGASNLAGSALTMDRAVANTVKFTGLPFEQVIPMATIQPAQYVGLEPRGRVKAEWDPEHYALNITSISV